MAKPHRLRELQALYGDLEDVIPAWVNEGGQKAAADALGTSTSTIARWLKDNGYYAKIVWVKAGSEVEAAYMLESEGAK